MVCYCDRECLSWFLGFVDWEMERVARLGTGNFRNAARNLHRFVHREGKTLPITISTCKMYIKKSRKGAGEVQVNYPILRLTTWLEFLLGSAGSEFVLGGCNIREEEEYMRMFERFWDRFSSLEPFHEVYQKSREDRARTIPMALHGDEGRGLCGIPVLIETFQPLIPWMGEEVLNMLGLLG